MQMEKLTAYYNLWVLMIVVSLSGYQSCLKEERLSLLDIKAYLKVNGVRTDHVFSSWIADPWSDCCNWVRVKCNSTTGRVVELSLNNTSLLEYNQILEKQELWFVNMSLFLPFEELRYLDLSKNWFSGCLEDHGFDKLSILKNLQVLNLGSNTFDNNILQSLGLLTSLRILNLQHNRFEGYSPARELAALNNLETLDLTGNYRYGSLPLQGFERLSTLKKLVELRLDSNGFDNSMLSSLSQLITLQNLSLGGNILRGSFPCKELGTLENLEMLDLSVNAFSDPPIVRDCFRFKKLTKLILDFNQFNDDILPFLSVFTTLESLSLAGNKFQATFPVEELAALRNLTLLDLSFNNFNGSIKSEGLSKFKKLETLKLAGNRFMNSVLQSLGAVTSLKTLDLSLNLMQGAFPDELTNLKNLENLDLSTNLLNSSLPIEELARLSNLKILNLKNNLLTGTLQIEGLATLKCLEILDLSNNRLIGHISPSIGSMASLKALSLANNKLNGSLPPKGFCELTNLQELDLSQNNLSGVLPSCLSSLTSLRLLDLSFNRLEGKIYSSLVPTLASLEYIDLSHNHFEGAFSFSSIANHTNLKVLMIGCGNSKLKVETGYSSWLPKFQIADLSHNNLTGIFPKWLLENNINLDFLSLRNNSLFGQFHLSPNSSSNIFQMDISENYFHGQLQENIGAVLPKVSALNVSENAFTGSISPVRNMPNLLFLDLSSNNFSGEVTGEFAVNCSQLVVLKLSNNRLRGQIPNLNQSISLMSLQLSENSFTGTLPNSISQSSVLYNIDISGNYMSGEIPSFGNNSSLSAVIMRDNGFRGKISCELLASVMFILDLSYNSISGPLPSCDLSYLYHLNLQGNKITGSIPRTLFNSSNLLTLNLKNNCLTGEIITSVVAYSDLRVLLLRGNLFSGLIPDQLCQFNNISMLDLSDNSFSGSIPHCFSNITFGSIKEYVSILGESFEVPIPRSTIYNFESLLQREIIHEKDIDIVKQVEVEFITKTRANIYTGSILDLMSGLDLSCNHLTGEIPSELGKLSWIHALNLSHNQLTGSIPSTFSSLSQIESLDLSFNNLSGEIPSALISLNFLQVFSVAHNNLSGRVPEKKAQFGTFENNIYEGNPFLCGTPLEKSCSAVIEPPTAFSDSSEEKWYEIDPLVFKGSFTAAYVMFLLGFLALLYINPYWRRKLFYFIEDCMYSCYFFVSSIFQKSSAKICG
eukprot:XP_015573735.2 receptor-like protein 15 isoform X2 [Ricinus communis]